MTYYEVLLLVHVLGVAVWLGVGVALLVIGNRFRTGGDNAGLKSLFDQTEWLTQRIFIPVSLLVLVLRYTRSAGASPLIRSIPAGSGRV